MGEDVLQLCGTTISGKYRVDSVAGGGSFGIVYRGWHVELNAPIAIKCLRNAFDLNTELFESFRREARLLSGLVDQHPAIVRVYDFGLTTTPSGAMPPYLVLEWLDGQDLKAALADRWQRGDGPYSEREALALLRPAIAAIAAAHQAPTPIAHRDLKPANLFITSDAQRMKVLDFGISKVMEAGDTATRLQRPTESSFSSFSPYYGAPEQFDTQAFGSTGPWTDVHALGLILVELVTGKNALKGDQEWKIVVSATAATRPTPRATGHAVSDAFEALCSKALALRPVDRYRDAAQLLAAIDATPTFSSRPAPARTVTPRLRSKRWLATTVVLALAGVAVGVGFANRDAACDASDPEQCAARCDAGNAESCTRLGFLYASGEHVTLDVARARQLLERGCDGGSALGCFMLGNTYLQATPSGSVPVSARRLYQQACVGGNAAACGRLGIIYMHGWDAPKSHALADKLLRQACDGDDADGCSGLGIMLYDRDQKEAARLYKLGCDGGSSGGCVELAAMYEKGVEMSKDIGRAIELYDYGCEHGQVKGCLALVSLYESGEAGVKDPVRANSYLQAACDAGDATSCTKLGRTK